MEEILVPGLGHHSNLKDMAPVWDSEPGPTARQGQNPPEAEHTQARDERGMGPLAARSSAQATNDVRA